MENAVAPIATDETLLKVAEALSASNLKVGAIREILQSICDKMDKPSGSGEASAIFYVDVTYDGSKYALADGLSIDAIDESCADGSLPVLRITNTTTGTIYRLAQGYNRQVSGASQYFWISHANNSPDNKDRVYIIVGENVLSSELYATALASNVSCNVEIAGTTYTTLDTALAAIAEKLNS